MKIQTSFKSLAGAIAALALSGSAALAAAGDGNIGMTILGAQVSAAGALNFGAGATGVTKLGTGIYQVDFSRDVTQCFYNAVSFTNTVPIFVEPRSGDATGVFIEFTTLGNTTTNPALTDSQFYLTVYCAK